MACSSEVSSVKNPTKGIYTPLSCSTDATCSDTTIVVIIGGVSGRRFTLVGRGDVGTGGGDDGVSAKGSVTRTLVRLGGGGIDRLGGGDGTSSVIEPVHNAISRVQFQDRDTYHSCQAAEQVEVGYPVTMDTLLHLPSVPSKASLAVGKVGATMAVSAWTGG